MRFFWLQWASIVVSPLYSSSWLQDSTVKRRPIITVTKVEGGRSPCLRDARSEPGKSPALYFTSSFLKGDGDI